jgi:hypothetical protein
MTHPAPRFEIVSESSESPRSLLADAHEDEGVIFNPPGRPTTAFNKRGAVLVVTILSAHDHL